MVAFTLVAALTFETARLKSNVIIYTAWIAAAIVPVVAHYVQGGAPPSLFGPDRGFFSLTPATYVALVGTFAYIRQNAFWAAASLSLLVLWFLTGSDLTAAVALLAPGLAQAIEWARRRPLAAVAPLVTFAIVWNYWLMVQYTAGTIPKDAPVSFAAMVLQQADVHTRAPYIYPFAFPANVLFAWREGVPIDRYDVLSAEPRREQFELTIERGAERFLLDGWGPPGANEVGPFRWLNAERATLAFPLQPSSGDLVVEVLATARGGAPSTATELTFELNGHPIGRAHVSPVTATEARLPVPAANVGRVLRAGYNRLSIVTSGNHRIAIHRVRILPAS
ncbi:MAG TPA: hypothetical protein VMO26_26265 [Vicinamibacterales bacterium]|nr:hypothetical protein [Vicinamibacterales bacterium]